MAEPISTQSLMSRLGSGIWQILIGLILMITSFYLVFWNEDIGLHGIKPEQLGGHVIIRVPNSPVDFNNNNKLIYTYGMLTSNNVLQDPLLGFSDKVIKIERRVEMYQWSQTEESKREKLADGSEREIVTYVYKPLWSKDLIDSNGFKDAVAHRNPVNMPLNALKGQAQDISVGDFHLAPELITQISGDVPVDLSNADISNIQRGTKLNVQHNGNFIFIGANPQSPAIGDVRISILKITPQIVSIIAQQIDTSLHQLAVQGGQPIGMVVLGQVSPKEMLHKGQAENRNTHWLICLGTLILMLIGAGLIVKPLAAIASTTPSVSGILRLGTVLTAFLLGLGVWTIATAIAWFVIKPMWAIALLIIVIGIYFIVFSMQKRSKQEST